MELEDLRLPKDWDGWARPCYGRTTRIPMRHRHVELEVNLVLHGRATYLLEGMLCELKPRSLFWQFPKADHALLDVSSDLQMWVVVYRPNLLRRRGSPEMRRVVLARRPSEPVLKQIGPEALARLDSLAREMQEFQDDRPRYNAALGYWLFSAWTAHQAGQVLAPGGDVHPAVARAAHAMNTQNDDADLPSLARQAGLSASRLSRLFAEQVGQSIVTYRQRIRLDRFQELYGQGNRYNVTEAALRAGFGSYPQFHRVFRKHFGFGPAEYRRRVRG